MWYDLFGIQSIKSTFAHCSKSSFFVQKFNFDVLRKLSIFLGEKVVKMLGFWTMYLDVDNFDFTRKIVKKKMGKKLVKMLGGCQNWIFGQKFDFSNSASGGKFGWF